MANQKGQTKYSCSGMRPIGNIKDIEKERQRIGSTDCTRNVMSYFKFTFKEKSSVHFYIFNVNV